MRKCCSVKMCKTRFNKTISSNQQTTTGTCDYCGLKLGSALFKRNKRMSDTEGGSQSVARGTGRGEGVRAEQRGS